MKAAYVSQRIEPSEATQRTVKDRAVAFVQQVKTLTDFTTLAATQNLKVETSSGLKTNDFTLGQLGASEYSRDVVKWAFNEKTKVGNVSQEVFGFRDANGGFFDTHYVVAALKGIVPEGSGKVAALKTLPEAEAKVRSQKKGEILKGKITNVTDLQALAAQWSTKVDTAKGSSMMQAGGEPRVIGTVFSLPTGTISSPIIGSGGVYVVQPLTAKKEAPIPADLSMFRKQVSSTATSAVRTNLMSMMKKHADLVDNRSRFF